MIHSSGFFSVNEDFPGQPQDVQLKTRWGTFDHVVGGEPPFLQSDIGKAFRCSFKLNRDRGARLQVVEKMFEDAVDRSFLISAQLVFYRKETNEVLFVSKNNSSAGSRLIAKMNKHFLPGHLDQSAHSTQTKKKARTTRCSFEELMHGLDIGQLSNTEVLALSRFDDPDSFDEFMGRRAFTERVSHTALHERAASLTKLCSEPAFAAILDFFLEECKRRAHAEINIAHGFREFPGSIVTAKPGFGSADEFWTFSAIEDELKRDVLETHFSGPVEICRQEQGEASNIGGPAFVDVVDDDGLWYTRLFLCIVPPDMIDPLTGSLQGLKPKAHHCRYAPEWLNASDDDFETKVRAASEARMASLPAAVAQLIGMANDDANGFFTLRRKSAPVLKEPPQAMEPLGGSPGQQQKQPGTQDAIGSLVTSSAHAERPKLQLKPRSKADEGAKVHPLGSSRADVHEQGALQEDIVAQRHEAISSGRPKLQLKPRTKPIGCVDNGSSANPKIFGDQRR